MNKLKDILLKQFESFFVLGVLVVTSIINFFIPYKLAFLNFYFLPVILGGYFLGQRLATLGALLCIIIVGGLVYIKPGLFLVSQDETILYAQVAVWGGFLILAGVVVGNLHERLREKVDTAVKLNGELEAHQEELSEANAALKDHSDNLEGKIRERTAELEQSRNAMESMKKKVESALYSTMDPVVVNLMIEGRLNNDKRDISLMFSDLVSFSGYSEKNPPEVVISDLNRYLADMEPIIHAYRGHIDKYMGDGIMCEFGAPVNHPTFRTMATVSGLKLQQQLRKQNYPWEMRVGIATGPAFTGLIGNKRQTYTAIGDAVNLASRLEKACTPGSVLIDRNTYDAVAYCVEARRMRRIGLRVSDMEKAARIDDLYDAVTDDPGNADIHYHLARLHMEVNDPGEAFIEIEKALLLDPQNTAFKVFFAEVAVKAKEADSISVKGKKQRVEAFEVTGFRDPLTNGEKIPGRLQREMIDAANMVRIPDDIILPVEVLEDRVGRSRVVAALSYAIATAMGVHEREKLEILNAGYISDIGKEALPFQLLNRNDSLSVSELEIYRQHPEEGTRILRKLGYESQSMLSLVANAHERWNGSGYPCGVVREDIPLGSRIISVADAYDALTSRRVHRDAWARSGALAEIRHQTEAGFFDPRIVAVLDGMLSAA